MSVIIKKEPSQIEKSTHIFVQTLITILVFSHAIIIETSFKTNTKNIMKTTRLATMNDTDNGEDYTDVEDHGVPTPRGFTVVQLARFLEFDSLQFYYLYFL